VVYDLACHTYGQTQSDGSVKFYACMPCDSAIRYLCRPEDDRVDGCGWEYTDGLNPANPKSPANEEARPSWLEGHELWVETAVISYPVSYPGVPSLWE